MNRNDAIQNFNAALRTLGEGSSIEEWFNYAPFAPEARRILNLLMKRSYPEWADADGVAYDVAKEEIDRFLRSRGVRGKNIKKSNGQPFTVAVDLHKTLMDTGPDGDDYEHGEPLPGAVEAMERFRDEGYRIIVWTCWDDLDSVRDWLASWRIPFDEVNANPWGNNVEADPSGRGVKIDADAYVDDKGVRFSNWTTASEEVRRMAERIGKRLIVKSLSTKEWKEVYDLPANGQIHQTSFGRAVHYAATAIQVESVIAEKAGQHFRRRRIRGYWNASEPVDGLSRNIPLFDADPFGGKS